MIKLKDILNEYQGLIKAKSGKFELKPDFEQRLFRQSPLKSRTDLAYYGWSEAKNKNFEKLDKIYRHCLRLEELIGFTPEIKNIVKKQEKDFHRQLVKTYKDYNKIYKGIK